MDSEHSTIISVISIPKHSWICKELSLQSLWIGRSAKGNTLDIKISCSLRDGSKCGRWKMMKLMWKLGAFRGGPEIMREGYINYLYRSRKTKRSHYWLSVLGYKKERENQEKEPPNVGY